MPGPEARLPFVCTRNQYETGVSNMPIDAQLNHSQRVPRHAHAVQSSSRHVLVSPLATRFFSCCSLGERSSHDGPRIHAQFNALDHAIEIGAYEQSHCMVSFYFLPPARLDTGVVWMKHLQAMETVAAFLAFSKSVPVTLEELPTTRSKVQTAHFHSPRPIARSLSLFTKTLTSSNSLSAHNDGQRNANMFAIP